MFDPTQLLGSLLGGVLDVRPKRHAQARRFLSGASGSVWNAKTLLTAGALGWAAYEIWRTRSGGAGSPTLGSQTVVPGTVVVPSAAPAPSSSAGAPPPLPPQAAAPTAAALAVDPPRRLVGVLLAAARCDGDLGEVEYGRLLAIAREHGAADLVGAELRQPTPLAALAGGVADAKVREDLYRLAFTVVRCDEGVSPNERAWLAQLAAALGLDGPAAARLEREVAQGITAA